MPFCPYCGTPVREDHRFCPSCGKELEHLPPQSAAPAPSQMEPQARPTQPPVTVSSSAAPQAETVRTVIPNLMVPKSFGRQDVYNLVVTNRRSIFAKLTNEIATETVKMRRDQAAADGKGFFGQWKAQLAGLINYGDRYFALTPDQALNETQGNFAVDNSMIRGIKTKSEGGDEDEKSTWEIEISTVSEKLKFQTQYDPRNILKQAYG